MSAAHPLRDWRKKLGPFEGRDGEVFSQERLATELEVVPSHLSQIETGDRQPSLDLAVRLSEFTGIPVAEFVKAKADAA